jgi:hypothetical protein
MKKKTKNKKTHNNNPLRTDVQCPSILLHIGRGEVRLCDIQILAIIDISYSTIYYITKIVKRAACDVYGMGYAHKNKTTIRPSRTSYCTWITL